MWYFCHSLRSFEVEMKHFCQLQVKELAIHSDLNFKLRHTDIDAFFQLLLWEPPFPGGLFRTPDQRSSVKANVIISSRWNGGKLPLPLQGCKFQTSVSFDPRNAFLWKADGAHTRFPLKDFGLTEHLTLLSTEIKVSVGTFFNKCRDIRGAYCKCTLGWTVYNLTLKNNINFQCYKTEWVWKYSYLNIKLRSKLKSPYIV